MPTSKNLYYLFFSFVFLAAALCAAAPGFAQNNAPIHPLCLYEAMPSWDTGEAQSVNLDKCEAENKSVLFETLDDGLIKAALPSEMGIVAYRVVTDRGANLITVTYENSGGTGTFTFIDLVKITSQGGARMMTVERLFGGGDRCAGGISRAAPGAENKNLIEVSVGMTPGALFGLAKDENLKKQGEEKRYLPECATCCGGEAVYHYDLERRTLSLDHVVFQNNALASLEQTPHIQCLQETLQDSSLVQDMKIAPAGIDLFLHDFISRCTPDGVPADDSK